MSSDNFDVEVFEEFAQGRIDVDGFFKKFPRGQGFPDLFVGVDCDMDRQIVVSQPVSQKFEKARHCEFESLLLRGVFHEGVHLMAVSTRKSGVSHGTGENLLVGDGSQIFIPGIGERLIGERGVAAFK